MESINEKTPRTQYAKRQVLLSGMSAGSDAPAAVLPLDINRETRSTVSHGSFNSARETLPDSNASSYSVTEKKSPDLTFSEDEKRAFRDLQARRARDRGDAAFEIAATALAAKKRKYEETLERYPGIMSRNNLEKTVKRVYKLAKKYEKDPAKLGDDIWYLIKNYSNAEDVKRAYWLYTGDEHLEAGACGSYDTQDEFRTRLAADVPEIDEINEIIRAYGDWQKTKSALGSFLKCRKEKKRDDLPAELVARADGSFSLVGRWRCRSKWACPECAAGLLYGDAMRLRRLFEQIQAENARRAISADAPEIVCLLVTLTAPHKPGEDLRQQMRIFSSSFSEALHARAMRDARARLGFLGSVRCFDHTLKINDLGITDFHTHFHAVLVFETDELKEDNAPALCDFAGLLFDCWAKQVDGAYGDGRKASARAFHVEKVCLTATAEHDAATVADYAAKACALPGYLTKSDKAGSRKDGAGLLPFEVLDAYAVEQDERTRAALASAWVAYVMGTKGFHRMDFSSGLSGRFCVDDDAPAVVARYELPPEIAAAVMRDPGLLEQMKRAVSDGDLDAVDAVISAAGSEADAVDLLTPAAPDDAAAPMTEDQVTKAALAALLRSWVDDVEQKNRIQAARDARYTLEELDETPF